MRLVPIKPDPPVIKILVFLEIIVKFKPIFKLINIIK